MWTIFYDFAIFEDSPVRSKCIQAKASKPCYSQAQGDIWLCEVTVIYAFFLFKGVFDFPE